MVRVVLSGEDLIGFTSMGFDDHVKLTFGMEADTEVRRDFTPRKYDATAGELWIDFFLHGDGPASQWAAHATTGQTLEVGGPKGSMVIDSNGIDAYLLIGDETALPAISRRLEELPAHTHANVVVETEPGVDRPTLASPATLTTHWVDRDPKGPPEVQLIEALRRIGVSPSGCFAWVAHESHVARAIRTHLVEERGFGKKWVKAAGYWQRGTDGAHEPISD
jgi:NADPH-dependent ferric siderophore reductase